MATEHTLRLKAQLDVSQAESQLNRLNGKAASRGSQSASSSASSEGTSLNQALRAAGFFAAARQFQSAAEKLNAAAGEMRSAVADAMSKIGSMGMQGLAIGGARGGAIGMAVGGAVAALEYFTQQLNENASALERQVAAQNEASRNANQFIALADAAKEAENFSNVLKSGSIPALEALKQKYDENITALEKQVQSIYERAKTTNQLGSNEKAIISQLETEKNAREQLVDAINKQAAAEHTRLKNFVQTQQLIAQNRRDNAALNSGDLSRLQGMLAIWQKKASDATSIRDTEGLREAESKVDQYNAAIERYFKSQENEQAKRVEQEMKLAEQSKKSAAQLVGAKANYIERKQLDNLLTNGSLPQIMMAIERYQKQVLNAKDAESFNKSTRIFDELVKKAEDIGSYSLYTSSALNSSMSNLRQQGIYMGENAVEQQTVDYTKKTSETLNLVKDLLEKMSGQIDTQTTVLKDNSGTTLG